MMRATKEPSVPTLIPHRLASAAMLFSDRAPVQETPYLAWTPEGWTATYQVDAAFVFPSETLARRFASAILAQNGLTWMPLPAENALSSVPPAGESCAVCGCTETFACPRTCSWHAPALCSECAQPRELEIWTVYQNPTDYPGKFIARRSLSGVPTRDVLVADTLDELRSRGPAGKAVVDRHPMDDAVIVETWM